MYDRRTISWLTHYHNKHSRWPLPLVRLVAIFAIQIIVTNQNTPHTHTIDFSLLDMHIAHGNRINLFQFCFYFSTSISQFVRSFLSLHGIPGALARARNVKVKYTHGSGSGGGTAKRCSPQTRTRFLFHSLT